MLATRIIAIRHGETAWNVDARIQGQMDIPLNEKGRWQAQRLARALAASETVDAIYCSDLLRAWDTAQSICNRVHQPGIHATGLRERRFGRFEGKTFTELEAAWPQETLRWRQRDPDWAPPQGESLREVTARVVHTTNKLAARHIGEQIVLVTHGGVLDVLYRQAAGLDPCAARTWTLGNASINRLLWTPQALTIVGWADTSHLEGEWQDEASA